MRLSVVFVTLASVLASAHAHATWQQLWINGVDAGVTCTRKPNSNSPVENVNSPAIACNNYQSNPNVCPINAGDTLEVEMHQQWGDRSCANEAIGGAHYGPVQVYMAKVDNAATADPNAANWFKVAEAGLVSNNPDYFASQVLNDNCGHFKFKVPSDIQSGDYLIRAEELALHAASPSGGYQFYPGCYQVRVSGGGSASPPTVKFPGAYSANHPGIGVNIHRDLTTYEIPGPSPYGTPRATVATTAWPTQPTWNTANQPSNNPTTYLTVGGGSPTQGNTTPTQGNTTPSQGNTTPTPTTTQGGSGAPLYGQCGGNGWSGPTTCAQGTCFKQNDWYSQCIP